MENIEHRDAGIPIATLEDVNKFTNTVQATGNDIPQSIQCLVAEVALTNRMRYDWGVMKPVYHRLMDACIEEFSGQMDKGGEEDETTARLGAGLLGSVAETEIIISKDVPGSRAYVDEKKKELHGLLDGYTRGAPCMVQRLSEVVLFPKKQYKDVSKLLRSLRVILSVMSTHDGQEGGMLASTMSREEFERVNENPPSPYL